LTQKYAILKLIISGVAGIQHFQAKKYSDTPGLRGGGSRYCYHSQSKKC